MHARPCTTPFCRWDRQLQPARDGDLRVGDAVIRTFWKISRSRDRHFLSSRGHAVCRPHHLRPHSCCSEDAGHFWPLQESHGPDKTRPSFFGLLEKALKPGGCMPSGRDSLSSWSGGPDWCGAATIAIMLPFAAIGIAFYNHASFGLVDELQSDGPAWWAWPSSNSISHRG